MAESGKTCSNCVFWKRGKGRQGKCSCPKFVYAGYKPRIPRDGLGYWDHEGYAASFSTGEAFGCIHFELSKGVEE